MCTVEMKQSGATAKVKFLCLQCTNKLATQAQLGCIALPPSRESKLTHPDVIRHGVAVWQHKSLPMLAVRMHG